MPDADDEDRISHMGVAGGLRSFVLHVSSELFDHLLLGLLWGV